MLKVEIPAGYLHDFCLFESKSTTACRPTRPIQQKQDSKTTLTTSSNNNLSAAASFHSATTPTASSSSAALSTTTNTIAAPLLVTSFEEMTSNWSTTATHEILNDFIPDFDVPDLCSFDAQELQRREAALLSQVDWDMYDEISPYSSTECINACSTECSSDDDEMDSPIMAEHLSRSSTSLSAYSSCTSVTMAAISCSGLSSIPVEMDCQSHPTYLPSPLASPMEVPMPSSPLCLPASTIATSSPSSTTVTAVSSSFSPSSSIENSLKRTRSASIKRSYSFTNAASDDDDDQQPEQPVDYDEEEEDDEEEEEEEEEEVKPRRARKRQAKMLTPPSTGSEEDSPVSSPGSGVVRKVSHNEMERKRRGELRMEFQRLRSQLPKLASEKAPKITILNEANVYIDTLHGKISTNKSSLAKLLKERDNLRRQLEQIRGR